MAGIHLAINPDKSGYAQGGLASMILLVWAFKSTWCWYNSQQRWDFEVNISVGVAYILYQDTQHIAEESWIFPSQLQIYSLVRENCFGVLIGFSNLK